MATTTQGKTSITSLEIEVDAVTVVLLADGWHEVVDKTFTLDAYEYLRYPDDRRYQRWSDPAGQVMPPGISGSASPCTTKAAPSRGLMPPQVQSLACSAASNGESYTRDNRVIGTIPLAGSVLSWSGIGCEDTRERE
jgi:hypothetical protein